MVAALAPQLATPADMKAAGRFVVDPNFVGEQKLDGHRVMLMGPGTDAPVAMTRNGSTYTRQIPTAIRKWRATGVDTSKFILDGELVGDTYWVFDFLLDGGDLDKTPLEDRRAILEELFVMFPDAPFKLVPQARTAVEKEALLLRAAAESLEGVVFKRKDAGYSRGTRSPGWVKVKFVQTADVVILAVRDDGKDSAKLGIYAPTKPGSFTVADFATGPDSPFLEVGRCSLIGKPAVKIGDVAEVRYLYVPDRAKPRLYQPTLIKVRTDKHVTECDGSDFKYTNKAVMETL